jgi:hypothetical protein
VRDLRAMAASPGVAADQDDLELRSVVLSRKIGGLSMAALSPPIAVACPPGGHRRLSLSDEPDAIGESRAGPGEPSPRPQAPQAAAASIRRRAVTPVCPSPLDRQAPLAAQAVVTRIC